MDKEGLWNHGRVCLPTSCYSHLLPPLRQSVCRSLIHFYPSNLLSLFLHQFFNASKDLNGNEDQLFPNSTLIGSNTLAEPDQHHEDSGPPSSDAWLGEVPESR